MVLGQGLRFTVTGLVVGIAAAFGLTPCCRRSSSTKPTDPATIVSVAAFIAFVAMAACLIPANRAARVDPMVVLRDSDVVPTPKGSWELEVGNTPVVEPEHDIDRLILELNATAPPEPRRWRRGRRRGSIDGCSSWPTRAAATCCWWPAPAPSVRVKGAVSPLAEGPLDGVDIEEAVLPALARMRAGSIAIIRSRTPCTA